MRGAASPVPFEHCTSRGPRLRHTGIPRKFCYNQVANASDFTDRHRILYCELQQIALLPEGVRAKHLGAFTTDTACQLDVFWHDGNTLGVDGAQVGVFE